MPDADYFSSSGFAPVTPQAASVNGLMITTLVVMGLIFLLVAGLIGIIVVRSRRSEADGDPPQVFGNTRWETGWTLGSLLTVALLFGLTLPVLRSSHPTEADNGAPALTVIGHQWWWEVRYPTDPPVFSANEVHIPVGQKSLLALESADVIHDFWVPQLGPKQDMIPGQTQHLWLEPKEAGIFEGACAEFCGNEHAWMRIRVIAESPEDYARWIHEQQTPLAAAARGSEVFQKYACNSCHAISGVGGRVAPDLTHIAQRQTLGAGVIVNTPQNLALWIKDPQDIKPQCNMPTFNLTDAEISDLVQYLEGGSPRP